MMSMDYIGVIENFVETVSTPILVGAGYALG